MELKRLKPFIDFVVYLFAAFGGFLLGVAPPEQTKPTFAVGVSSFLTLGALLLVAAFAKKAPASKRRNGWIAAGASFFILAIAAASLYWWARENYTYLYPPPPEAPTAVHINGSELTETAREFIQRNPGNWTPGTLELNLEYQDIWTAASIQRARALLVSSYIVLVLSLATMISCLLEANVAAARARKAGRTPRGGGTWSTNP